MKEAGNSTQVGLTVADGRATITLDGPRNHNALDEKTAAAVVAACEQIDADRSVGVAVLTGANRTFCSGAVRGFLAALAAEPADRGYEALGAVYHAFDRVGRLTVPTIARIEGAAVGAGVNLAMATDLRIAAADARIISGFAAVGIHPGGGHMQLLARAAGPETSAAMSLFARPLTGAQAKQCGLVWEAVDAEQLDAEVSDACAPLQADPELARALKSTFRLTVQSRDEWAAATEVERARQMWSLTRPRPEKSASATNTNNRKGSA